jgi:hypothetical protein
MSDTVFSSDIQDFISRLDAAVQAKSAGRDNSQ